MVYREKNQGKILRYKLEITGKGLIMQVLCFKRHVMVSLIKYLTKVVSISQITISWAHLQQRGQTLEHKRV